MKGLKLSRKVGEGFTAFFGDVELRVILEQVRGTRMAVLRIIGPKEVEILRDELLEEEDEDGGVSDPVVSKQGVPAQKSQSVSAAIRAREVD